MRNVVIVSGGMDSVTLAYSLAYKGDELAILSVDYGQRHVRELVCAERCATALGAAYYRVDLRSVTQLMTGSALTDSSVPVPHGHYAAPTMAQTVVPNRNAILLSLAYALAVSTVAERVATAVHAGDHYVYPDCRPEFLRAFSAMEGLATDGFAHPELTLYTPYAHLTKADIVREGDAIGVPYGDTYSCYEGELEHCGQCGTCTERREAFLVAGVPDPTRYRLLSV